MHELHLVRKRYKVLTCMALVTPILIGLLLLLLHQWRRIVFSLGAYTRLSRALQKSLTLLLVLATNLTCYTALHLWHFGLHVKSRAGQAPDRLVRKWLLLLLQKIVLFLLIFVIFKAVRHHHDTHIHHFLLWVVLLLMHLLLLQKFFIVWVDRINRGTRNISRVCLNISLALCGLL